MIVMRPAQLDAFRVVAQQRFDRRLLAAVAHSFTREFSGLGPAGLMAVVCLGRERAALQGWHSEQAVFLYLSLMLMLGAGFERDRLLPWVQAELARSAAEPALDRIFALHGTALDYLDEVAGERNEQLIKALLRLRDFDLGTCEVWAAEDAARRLAQTLSALYPAKAKRLGQPGLLALADAARLKAGQHGLSSLRALALTAGLMFLLGSDFDADPALAWVPKALTVDAEPPERERRLQRAAMDYLHQGLA